MELDKQSEVDNNRSKSGSKQKNLLQNKLSQSALDTFKNVVKCN